MDFEKELHELCETISDAIAEANAKIRSGGGKLSAGDVDYVDKLTHALKSVKAVIKMMDEDGYSGYYPADGTYRMYPRGHSYKRDSMGRYSRNYSRDGGMVEELRELMRDAPDDRTRQEFQRFISKIESM